MQFLGKIMVSAMAITVLSAGVAEAKDRAPKAPAVVVLSDGSTIERASVGKTRVFGRTSVIDLAFRCSPQCVQIAEVTAEGPGIMSEVLNSFVLSSVANAAGFVEGMKNLRPPTTSTFMYQEGSSANAGASSNVQEANCGSAFICDANTGLNAPVNIQDHNSGNDYGGDNGKG
jgi:hypothetical protein